MKIQKILNISIENICLLLGVVFVFSVLTSSLAIAGEWPSVADPKGIKTKFPQQLELGEYQKQTGKKLTFNENPVFAEKVKKGELPALEKRLPEEPLVVIL